MTRHPIAGTVQHVEERDNFFSRQTISNSTTLRSARQLDELSRESGLRPAARPISPTRG